MWFKGSKIEVKTHYKRLIKKAQRTRKGDKKISELHRLKNEEEANEKTESEEDAEE